MAKKAEDDGGKFFLTWIVIPIILFPILGVLGIGAILAYEFWWQKYGVVSFVKKNTKHNLTERGLSSKAAQFREQTKMSNRGIYGFCAALAFCFALVLGCGASTIDDFFESLPKPKTQRGQSGFCATEARTFSERSFINSVCN